MAFDQRIILLTRRRDRRDIQKVYGPTLKKMYEEDAEAAIEKNTTKL